MFALSNNVLEPEEGGASPEENLHIINFQKIMTWFFWAWNEQNSTYWHLYDVTVENPALPWLVF